MVVLQLWEEEHAGGRLRVLNVNAGGDGGKWNAEHTLRVWTPPGYNQDEAKKKGNLPVRGFPLSAHEFTCSDPTDHPPSALEHHWSGVTGANSHVT
eukprot:1193667-Prorocentrum_minimum.AAC.4